MLWRDLVDALVQLPLGVRVLAEQPLAGRPVAGVVAHRRQEGDLVRVEVADDRDEDADHQDHRQQQGVEGGEGGAAVLAEEEEEAEDHEQVPLQGDAEGEGGGDVDVEQDHRDHRDGADGAAVADEQDEGPSELPGGAEVGGERGELGGTDVVGPVPPQHLLHPARAVPGGVADHHRDHVGEVMVQLRGRGAPPDADHDQLPADDPGVGGEQGDDQEEAVDLGAGGEEGDLVAQAEQRQQAEEDDDRGAVERGRRRPRRAAGRGRLRGRPRRGRRRGRSAGYRR